MKLSVNGCFKNLLYGRIHLTDYFAGAPRSPAKKTRNIIKVIPARSGTNLIFQLTGVPSRKEASNCAFYVDMQYQREETLNKSFASSYF